MRYSSDEVSQFPIAPLKVPVKHPLSLHLIQINARTVMYLIIQIPDLIKDSKTIFDEVSQEPSSARTRIGQIGDRRNIPIAYRLVEIDKHPIKVDNRVRKVPSNGLIKACRPPEDGNCAYLLPPMG